MVRDKCTVAQIVWGANRKPYAASSNTPLHLTTMFQGHPFSETTVNGVLWPNSQIKCQYTHGIKLNRNIYHKKVQIGFE